MYEFSSMKINDFSIISLISENDPRLDDSIWKQSFDTASNTDTGDHVLIFFNSPYNIFLNWLSFATNTRKCFGILSPKWKFWKYLEVAIAIITALGTILFHVCCIFIRTVTILFPIRAVLTLIQTIFLFNDYNKEYITRSNKQ